ncbi:MAG: glycosyltransferase [Deltaproteobacteria bacterium]|nr:glycosyltransferase [Deltaproteobacteria bacterium]
MRILVLTTACDPARDSQFHLYEYFARTPEHQVLVIAPQCADATEGGVPAPREERLGRLWISRLYRDIPEMWDQAGKKLSAALSLAKVFDPQIVWFWHENNFPLAHILSSQMPGKPPLVGYLEIPTPEILESAYAAKVPFLLSGLLSDRRQEEALTRGDTCFLAMEAPVEVPDLESYEPEKRLNRGIFGGGLDAWYKGADRFAKILPRLFEETPMERFLLVSRGSKTALRIAEALGKRYPIDYLSNLPRTALFREIARSFFALTAATIASPGSFPVECLALGTPVLAAGGSLGEVIRDGETGVRSIASLNRLYGVPSLYQQVQKQARVCFRTRFSAASVGRRCLNIFQGMLTGRTRQVWEELRHRRGETAPAPAAAPVFLSAPAAAAVAGPLRLGLQLPNINTFEGAVDGDEVMAVGMARVLSGLEQVEFAEVYDPVTVHDNLDVILHFYPFPLLRPVPGPRHYWWYQARVPEEWTANPEWRRCLALYEGFFAAGPALKQHLLSWGAPARKIALMPMSCDREVYRPRAPVEALAHPVVFCGNGGIRAPEEVHRYLTPLVDLGLAVFGSHWERFPELKAAVRGPIRPTEVPALYSSAAIILSTHTAWHRRHNVPTSRLWEALGCDGVVVSDHLPWAEELFGDAVVWTGGFDDLREKVAYLLAHPEERERIKGKGRRLIDRRLSFNHYLPQLVEMFRTGRMWDIVPSESRRPSRLHRPLDHSGDGAAGRNRPRLQVRRHHPAAIAPLPQPSCPPASRPESPEALHLLLVAHSFRGERLAGTEIYTYNLAQELRRRGHRVGMLYPVYRHDAAEGEITETEHEGLELARINVTPGSGFLKTFKNRRAAAGFGKYLARKLPHLVHFHHLLGISALALEECARQGIPAVLTAHDAWLVCEQCHFIHKEGGYCQEGPATVEKCVECILARHPDHLAGQKLPRLIHRVALRRRYLPEAVQAVQALLTPSRFLRDLLRSHGIDHPRFLVSPLGLEPFPTLPRQPSGDAVRFTFLGYLNYTKGLDILIRAFNALDSPKARLDLYGDILGLTADQFRRVMALVKPGVRLAQHGPYTPEDLPEILARTDVAVVPSRFESYSFVTRECLHAGVPVIASRVGGIPEIIEDGVNGLLFEPGNPEHLAEKLRFFVDHPEAVAAFRRRIRPVKSIAADAEELLSLYRQLLPPGISRLQSATIGGQAPPEASEGSGDAPATPKPQPAPITPGSPAPAASIIIPVYNNLALTRQCLESIWEHTEPGDFRVLVIDNGSTDGTGGFLRRQEETGRLQAIHNPRNLGFAKACNQGAEAAAGEFLVFLNNDTKVLPGWLQGLTDCARKRNDIGAVGAKLLYPDDTIQHAGVAFNPEKHVFHIYRNFHKDHPAVNKEREYQCVTAACLLVKPQVFFEAGLFDEQYRNGFEDVDLCFQISKLGYKIIYTPHSQIYHLESKTPGRKDNERENALRFLNKWHHSLMPDEDYYYQQDGIAKEILLHRGKLILYLHDENENHFWRKAQQYKHLQKYEEALAQYELAYKFNPYDPRKITIAEEIAALHEILGRLDKAAFLYRTILAEYPAASLEAKLKRVLEKQNPAHQAPDIPFQPDGHILERPG